MPTPRERQRALKDWVLAAPGTAGPPPIAGAAVHHDNTLAGLTAALAATFPVVARLVGDNCFAGLAGAFIRTHPPREAPLLRYGGEFPVYLADHPAVTALPYLADVARLEVAWNHVHHAPDLPTSETVGDTLARLGDAAAAAILRLTPAHRFVASAHPVDLIWRTNQPGDDDPSTGAAIDLGDPAHAAGVTLLVCRPDTEVLILRQSPGAFAFLMAVAAGASLATAWDSASAMDAAFDLQQELTGLLAARVFTGVDLP